MTIKQVLFSAVFFLSCISAVAQTTSPAPYCSADFDDVDGTFDVVDQIKSVSFGTLSNITNSQSAFPHYTFYNNLAIPDVAIGTAYPFSITFEVHGGAGYGVWIDYNHNSIFEANELVSGSLSNNYLEISNNTIIAGDITISPIAMAGQTRMRVRIVEDDMYTAMNGPSIAPCNASTSAEDIMDWGETEDYTVNIVSNVGINSLAATTPISVFPNPVLNVLNVNGAKADNYCIYSVDGVCVKSGVLSSGNQISTADFASGFYVLQVLENGSVKSTSRFIKAGH